MKISLKDSAWMLQHNHEYFYFFWTLQNKYLKSCLLLRISGHVSSANAQDSTSSSNNLL
jgi:hypothetical protein